MSLRTSAHDSGCPDAPPDGSPPEEPASPRAPELRGIGHGGICITAVESAASVASSPNGHDELPRGLMA
jgi:hypothetical protein